MNRLMRIVKWLAAGMFLLYASYFLFFHNMCNNWGAYPAEQQMYLPGDSSVPSPKTLINRAITIRAKPENVFPWLVQLGINKGGMYSYDWLENVFGLKVHSADSIVPRFQSLHLGDTLLLGPMGGPQLCILEPDRLLVFCTREAAFQQTWAFALLPQSDGNTRLLVRSRYDWAPGVGNYIIWRLITDPMHFVMEEKMLRGIRDRAEKTKAI